MPTNHHRPDPTAVPSAPAGPLHPAGLPLPAEPSGPAWEGPRNAELRPLSGALREHLPEFTPTCRRLVEAGDDDPGDPVLLMELADFIGARLVVQDAGRRTLERALGVIEGFVDSLGDDEDGRELVGAAFFDSLSPESRRLLAPWLGPQSMEVLEAFEASLM